MGFLWGALLLLTLAASVVLKHAQPPQPQPTVPEAEGRREVSRGLFGQLQRQLRAQLATPLAQAVSFRRSRSTRAGTEGGRELLGWGSGKRPTCIWWLHELHAQAAG